MAAELDSLDGRKDPQRCTLLVSQFRSCQVSGRGAEGPSWGSPGLVTCSHPVSASQAGLADVLGAPSSSRAPGLRDARP